MNPFDAVGTARISSAVYDRVCRLSVDYQSADEEAAIVTRAVGEVDPDWVQRIVELVRRTRNHPDLRVGSSVRGALDATAVVASLVRAARPPADEPRRRSRRRPVALSGRVRLREGCARTAEEIITELWFEVFGDAGDPTATATATRREKSRPRRGRPLPEGGGEPRPPRSTTPDGRRLSRRELARHPDFARVSPELGALDEAAFDELMAEDPDDALGLLADMTRATDGRLRELARRLAGRLVLDVARRGPTRPRGVGRIAVARVRARRR